jgi:hypothetical protein
VIGSKFCSSHDGEKFSATPERMRRRKEKPKQRCTATKRNGEPCSRYALAGATVCTSHGGNLPSVRASARDRLLELVLPAIEELEAVLTSPTSSNADKLRAVQLVLDRTGHGTKSELEVTVKPWEVTLKGIMRERPADAGNVFVLPRGAYEDDDDDDDLEPELTAPIDRELHDLIERPRTVGSNTPPLHPDLRKRREQP